MAPLLLGLSCGVLCVLWAPAARGDTVADANPSEAAPGGGQAHDQANDGAVPAARESSASLEDAERARALFWRAHERYRRGRYDEAVALFEQSFVLVPQPETRFNIALAHARNGDCEGASREYREYSRLMQATQGAKVMPFPEDAKGQCSVPSSADPAGTPAPAPPPAEPPPQSLRPASIEPEGVVVQQPVPSATSRASSEVTPPVDVEPQDSRRRKILGWSLVGSGAVVAGFGVYFYARSLDAARDARRISDAARDAPGNSPDDAGDRVSELERDAKRAQIAAIASGGAALVLAGTGAGLLWFAGSDSASVRVGVDAFGGLRLRVYGRF